MVVYGCTQRLRRGHVKFKIWFLVFYAIIYQGFCKMDSNKTSSVTIFYLCHTMTWGTGLLKEGGFQIYFWEEANEIFWPLKCSCSYTFWQITLYDEFGNKITSNFPPKIPLKITQPHITTVTM